eukprot:CAMPEP_0170519490 /NCGR_PEP_ID=MMETSP0209-20121228/4890_1 /TAXON_ID=665100 ORGANISM="Litonotus pictus, Strain P1" /NCGR_SAMPLE_ID=MMETSP0209 /ASSEMBLY_ACC=CAM_ASM_000301 /LENGTH=367 /DNA_ID=CAMNT_0010805387 /DNA_START=75 /DNA_END=1178 /DNA_ORIENTATION=+
MFYLNSFKFSSQGEQPIKQAVDNTNNNINKVKFVNYSRSFVSLPSNNTDPSSSSDQADDKQSKVYVPDNLHVFRKLARKAPSIPNIIVKPNRSKKYFQELQNKKGHFIKTDHQDFFVYSAKKLNKSVSQIRNLYLEDAEKVIEEDTSKGAKLIKKEIESFKKTHRKLLSTPECKLRIKSAITLKANGHHIPMFRAKGRVNYIRKKKSGIQIQFETVTKEKICQDLAKGRSPLFLRNRFREVLYKRDASLKEIKAVNSLTTNRGLYRRRNQLKVILFNMKKKFYQENKVKLNKNLLRERIVKEMGKQLEPVYDRYMKEDKPVRKTKKHPKRFYDREVAGDSDYKFTKKEFEEIKRRGWHYGENLRYDY